MKKPFQENLLLLWSLCPLLAFCKYFIMYRYSFVIMIAVMAGLPPQLLLFVSVKWLVFVLLYGGPKICLISLVRLGLETSVRRLLLCMGP